MISVSATFANSHGAHLIADNVDLTVISKWLRDSSIEVTFNRYGHLLPGLDAPISDPYA